MRRQLPILFLRRLLSRAAPLYAIAMPLRYDYAVLRLLIALPLPCRRLCYITRHAMMRDYYATLSIATLRHAAA